MVIKYLNNLTQERLKSVLHYNLDTGLFTWIKDYNRIGKIAGYLNPHGYIQIGVDYELYHAHRLAYLYVNGCWPEYEIDHINMNKNDNRWCNLRSSDRSQNGANKKKYKTNKSGIKGVHWDKDNKRWRASIQIDNRVINLGRYNNIEDAAKAYSDAANKYFKEYSRVD